MRGIVIVFALCVLAGCSTGPTLEELEAEALITGDWSLVEQREARIAERRQRQGVSCPAGMVSYCRTYMSESRCTCVEQDNLYSILYDDRY